MHTYIHNNLGGNYAVGQFPPFDNYLSGYYPQGQVPLQDLFPLMTITPIGQLPPLIGQLPLRTNTLIDRTITSEDKYPH